MSKFLAIFIAAVLILSLFLTVNSFGDKFESVGSNSSTTVPNSSMTSQTSSSQTDSNFYLDSSGNYGYSIVDGLCYYFVRCQVPSDASSDDYLFAYIRTNFEYTAKVRFSSDAKVWYLPQTVKPYTSHTMYEYDTAYFAGSYAYISICIESFVSVEESLQFCKDLFEKHDAFSMAGFAFGEIGNPFQPLPE